VPLVDHTLTHLRGLYVIVAAELVTKTARYLY